MREAFGVLLPTRILNRRKVGFSVPLALWLRTDLRDTMLDVLCEAEIRRAGYLQYGEVERIVREHLSGRANHENRLWALMNLVAWQRQWRGWRQGACGRADEAAGCSSFCVLFFFFFVFV